MRYNIYMKWFLIILAVFALGYYAASRKRKANFISEQHEEKERNKQAIYELLETNHPLRNNDVEAMIDISDATATRYFDELQKEGKVRQVGRTGKHVYYEKV